MSCHQHIFPKRGASGKENRAPPCVFKGCIFFSIKISAYSSGPQNSIANIIREPYT